MKPLLERIGILERELATAINTIASIKSAAGLALASDESTRERLETFLTALAGVDNREAIPLMEVLRRNMEAITQQQTLAALRGSRLAPMTNGGTVTGRTVRQTVRAPGNREDDSTAASNAISRIASAYGMSTATFNQLAEVARREMSERNDFGAAELRALAQAMQPRTSMSELQALHSRLESDDMVENVSEQDDMPDLSE